MDSRVGLDALDNRQSSYQSQKQNHDPSIAQPLACVTNMKSQYYPKCVKSIPYCIKVLSFLLSQSDTFDLLIVGVGGYCRISSRSMTHTYINTHTHTHTRQDSSGREIGPTQRPLPDNTQPSQDTDTHATSGIHTLNSSKRRAAVPRLRLRGHRHRLLCKLLSLILAPPATIRVT